MSLIICYIIMVNIAGGLLFALDKQMARCKKRRIPEATLHFLELGGAVFTIWILMYLIHHKNKKISYYSITYIVMACWIILLYSIIFKQI